MNIDVLAMSEDRSEVHLVPALLGQTLEDPLPLQCEFSEGKQESAVVLCSTETVSKLTVFLNPDIPGSLGNEEGSSSGSGTECYSDPPSHKSIDTPDVSSSSSSGSQKLTSDDESSSDSGEIAGNFNCPTERQGEEYSAVHEVVCGREFFNSFLKDQVGYVANLPVDQFYPQKQAGEFGDTSIVVPSSAWPPKGELKFDTTAAELPMDMSVFTHSIAEVESLTLQDHVQEVADKRKGSLVVGTSQCEPTSHVEIIKNAKDVISDQHHFLEKSVDVIGTALNPLVTNMHDDPNHDVKFRTKKKVYDIKLRDRRTTVTEDVPVPNPANSPEASDGRKVLKHMCQNYRQYADALNYKSSSNFKRNLKQIIGRIPKRRNHSLTWDSFFNTVYYMRSFMETIGECLEETDMFAIADCARDGAKRLREIAEGANQAYKFLQQVAI